MVGVCPKGLQRQLPAADKVLPLHYYINDEVMGS
jgi:hypothetical protein